MEPLFSEKQLQDMSKENIITLIQAMQVHQKKQETEIQLLKEKTKELEFMNALLSDRLALAQRKQFGSSSEKYAEGYEQMDLFNEAEQEADPNAAEPEMEEIHPKSYKRKKPTGKKEEDLSAFETTEVIKHKLEGNDRFCPECGTKYKVVTTETVKYLKFIPARFEVVEETTYVYACPKCGMMKRPQKDPSLLKGSVATPSLVAGIMNAKYVNGMPLARQEREFARYNLNLSTKTMANWIILCAKRYLQPIYDLMREEFLRSRYIHCDETRLQVIDEPEQKGTTQNWMWVYLTDEYSGSPRMVLFQYERTRGGYHPVEFLGDEFRGYLTCDGYQAYRGLPEQITVTGCMAHARRRFDEALTPLKKGFTKEQLKETTAYQAMARIGMLYKIEELIRNQSPEERYAERQKQSKPLLEAFFGWLHTLEGSVNRSSKIGEAVLYALNQEKYLKAYLEDGHLSIDNSAAERAIKNFAIGRRNWLFSKSIKGAEASATVYSITETALLNGLKPYDYVAYILERMKDLGPFPSKEDLQQLLPWSESIPESCRTNRPGAST
ncbi:IS66 family transposase [Schaedlerella arabinosiphila]|uniref:IS66 family transposase n=1 Tax=Schaedlerella arabinosiphila TaxID=2044587 RepID=A0A426DL52_9FIRM|nr:IS66 family transposase [Schaedlerella arabinosiphila]RRK33444.1 IS66 family transposase [Schaedlerella arabinosiphila]